MLHLSFLSAHLNQPLPQLGHNPQPSPPVSQEVYDKRCLEDLSLTVCIILPLPSLNITTFQVYGGPSRPASCSDHQICSEKNGCQELSFINIWQNHMDKKSFWGTVRLYDTEFMLTLSRDSV